VRGGKDSDPRSSNLLILTVPRRMLPRLASRGGRPETAPPQGSVLKDAEIVGGEYDLATGTVEWLAVGTQQKLRPAMARIDRWFRHPEHKL
jgi:hypothetical protein